MSSVSSVMRDKSITLSGASETLFSANTEPASFNSEAERYVYNASQLYPVSLNLSGGTAAHYTAGSITLEPGQYWSGKVAGLIKVIGTAGQPLTAGER